VAKYKGIANLLSTFICKSCAKASQPPRSVRPPRVARKRKSREVAPGVSRDENGRYDIPSINLNAERKSYSISEIALSPEMTRELTDRVCLQPHVYLDSNSTCDHCPLYDNCGCTGKQLSKARRKEVATV
jgi:hypothetical protein